MKYYILGLSFLFATTVLADKISHGEKEVKDMTVSQFKGDCLRMKAILTFEDGQWICTGKSKDEGLTSMPLKLPKQGE
jgi:hypothetical protein